VSNSLPSQPGKSDGKRKLDLRAALPEIWELVRPRKWLLALGLLLMAVNRVS